MARTAHMNTDGIRDLLAARSRDGAPREHTATSRFCWQEIRDAFENFQPFAAADGLQVHSTLCDYGTYTVRYAFIMDSSGVLLAAHTEHTNRPGSQRPAVAGSRRSRPGKPDTDTITWRYRTTETPQWLQDLLAPTELNELVKLARPKSQREALIKSGALRADEAVALVAEHLHEDLRAALCLIAAGQNTIDHLFSDELLPRTGGTGPARAFTALQHHGLIEPAQPLPPGRVLADDTQVKLTADGRLALYLIGQ